MEHLLIQAYSDEKFRSKHGGQITVLLNPESVKTGKGSRYRDDKQQGAVERTMSLKDTIPRHSLSTSSSTAPV